MELKQKGMNTPWGESQAIEKIADGIEFVSTASHGGYRLSAERLAGINPKAFTTGKYEGFRNNRKNGWFEEDCDWAFVAVAFPEHFPVGALEAAQATIKHFYPEVI
jgi:hypothetical protein